MTFNPGMQLGPNCPGHVTSWPSSRFAEPTVPLPLNAAAAHFEDSNIGAYHLGSKSHQLGAVMRKTR